MLSLHFSTRKITDIEFDNYQYKLSGTGNMIDILALSGFVLLEQIYFVSEHRSKEV